jgi:hypothetical protein
MIASTSAPPKIQAEGQDVRQIDGFPLFGPLERWISNPLRLIALQRADRRRIAAGIPAKHDAEIALLLQSDLSPQIGRYYLARSHLDESAQRNIRTVGRQLVEQWIADQPHADQSVPSAAIIVRGPGDDAPFESAAKSPD